jgi:transcriptional regulator with XRE-family HTH domain
MTGKGMRRDQQVEKVTREERLARRDQVNKLKVQIQYPAGGLTVRLRGLKACREAKGLTQQQLAKMSGAKQATISELEKRYGYRGAYISTVRRLSEALKVPPASLICKYEPSEESAECSHQMKRFTQEKGLDRTEQLRVLREQATRGWKDSMMVDRVWKVKLQGLESCRLAAGLSQRGLAKIVGTSQTTIAKLERGVLGAPTYMVRRLCRALKVLPADLICRRPVK